MMKQGNSVGRMLLKTWLGIVGASLLGTFCSVWIQFRNTAPSPCLGNDATYRGIVWVWSVLGVLTFSAGAATLFLNVFKRIRCHRMLCFLSFFFVPTLLIIGCGMGTTFFWTVTIPFVVCLLVGYGLFCKKMKQSTL